MAYVRQRGSTWYLGYLDAGGLWREQASKAQTKTEAKRLVVDLERKAERQRLGLEALPTDSSFTLAELCNWWLDHRCPASTRKKRRFALSVQVLGTKLGTLPLRAVTPAVLEARFAAMEEANYQPGTVNKLRSTLHTVFSRAKKAGVWTGPNPAADTETRKVARVVRDTLDAQEAEQLLPHVWEEWRGFFAAAIYLGLRKGECAGLRKADVSLKDGTLTVRASYDNVTTKGGHADVLPIPTPLLRYVRAGLQTDGPYLFPMPDGSMRPENSSPHKVLIHALGRAGLVEGYDHVCRTCKAKKAAVPHVERRPNDAERRCPVHGVKLWPIALSRKLRFHDLRHSCATVLLRAGVDAHRVQRILRHSDVRTTTATYAHLSVEDLRAGFSQTYGSPSSPAPHEARAVSGILPARGPIAEESPTRRSTKHPDSRSNSQWAEQGSNLRPTPCKGAALPLSYPPD